MKLPELKIVAWNYELEHPAFQRLIKQGIGIDTPLVTLSDANAAIQAAYEQGKKDAISGQGTLTDEQLAACGYINPLKEKNDEPV